MRLKFSVLTTSILVTIISGCGASNPIIEESSTSSSLTKSNNALGVANRNTLAIPNKIEKGDIIPFELKFDPPIIAGERIHFLSNNNLVYEFNVTKGSISELGGRFILTQSGVVKVVKINKNGSIDELASQNSITDNPGKKNNLSNPSSSYKTRFVNDTLKILSSENSGSFKDLKVTDKNFEIFISGTDLAVLNPYFSFKGSITKKAQVDTTSITALSSKKSSNDAGGVSTPNSSLLQSYLSLSQKNGVKIPAELFIKSKEGCYLFNQEPVQGETVSWSGKCLNGYAHGPGKTLWSSGNSHDIYLENGLSLNPEYNYSGPILSKKNSKCGFYLPQGKRLVDYLDVNFIGSCPTGSDYGEALISLNGQPFATYKGKFARGTMPVEGELTYFTGTKLIFEDKVDFWGFFHKGMVDDWVRGIKVVRNKANNDKSLYSLFSIKLKFNSTDNELSNETSRELILPLDVVQSNGTISLGYNVQPKNIGNIKPLNKPAYLITLNVSIDVKTDVSLFGGNNIFSALTSSTKNHSINKNVDIIVEKSNGFKKSGEVKISELTTFANALGTTFKTSVSHPRVELVSITPHE